MIMDDEDDIEAIAKKAKAESELETGKLLPEFDWNDTEDMKALMFPMYQKYQTTYQHTNSLF